MIELTDQQVQALENAGPGSPRFVNPRTREAFVLVRVEEYERLQEEVYDDSPWTREELEALAWENARRAGREDEWDEFNDTLETPGTGVVWFLST